MPKKRCTNPPCSMHDRLVETDKNNCLSCGRPLTTGLLGDFGGLFGNLSGGTFTGKTTIPADVRNFLTEVDRTLSIIVNGEGPVTKGQLRKIIAKARQLEGEYG